MGTGKLLGKPNKLRGSDLRWTSIPSRVGGGGGVQILLATSCYRNRDKLLKAAMSQSWLQASLFNPKVQCSNKIRLPSEW